ncbi:MAG: hypothetical protein WCP82_07030 [Alphaproteobacteria bacterium]
MLKALVAAEFEPTSEVLKGNEDGFFSADFTFHSLFEASSGLRPYRRVEITFDAPALPPIGRAIQSLLGQTQRETSLWGASSYCVGW